MGLHRRPGTVFSFDRNVAIEWADVPEVRIGPMRVAGIGMMVTRLADLSGVRGDGRRDHWDGCTQSGPKDLHRLRAKKRSSSNWMRGAQVRRPPPRALVIPVIIQGISMRLLVDTGFEYVLLYKDRLRRCPSEPAHGR